MNPDPPVVQASELTACSEITISDFYVIPQTQFVESNQVDNNRFVGEITVQITECNGHVNDMSPYLSQDSLLVYCVVLHSPNPINPEEEVFIYYGEVPSQDITVIGDMVTTKLALPARCTRYSLMYVTPTGNFAGMSPAQMRREVSFEQIRSQLNLPNNVRSLQDVRPVANLFSGATAVAQP